MGNYNFEDLSEFLETSGYPVMLLEPVKEPLDCIALTIGRSAKQPGQACLGDDASGVVDADTFKILVGAASDDIRLTSSLTNLYRQELSNSTSNPLSKADINAVSVKASTK
nr:hypothetical protein [Pseudomonas duriflava]